MIQNSSVHRSGATLDALLHHFGSAEQTACRYNHALGVYGQLFVLRCSRYADDLSLVHEQIHSLVSVMIFTPSLSQDLRRAFMMAVPVVAAPIAW